jgi:hypothetical protein
MADQGSRDIMTELILQEKELLEKIARIDDALVEPLARLAKAEELLAKAQAAHKQCTSMVQPLQSEKTLLEGELALVAKKKSETRMQARRIEVGGIRPGTQEFVDQMNTLAGDPEEARLKKQAADMDVEAKLKALKHRMDER